jgi:hypothetical protein
VERIQVWLVWGLLLGLSLVVSPGGQTETTKVMVFEVVTAVLLVIGLWRGNQKWTTHDGLLAGVICLIAIQAVTGLLQAGWWGNAFRLQGAVLVVWLVIWSWLTSKVQLAKISGMFWGLVLVLLIFSSWWLGGVGGVPVVGTVGEPNALAATGLFIWPWMGNGWWLGVFGTCWLIFMTGSRSGLVAILIQLGFWWLVRMRKWPIKRAVFIALILVIASWVLPWMERDRLWENRVEVWQTALAAGSRRPFLGWGFGNVEIAMRDTAEEQQNNLRWQYVDSAHNIFLDWWVQGGVVGLGLLLGIICAAFTGLIRQKKVMELTMLLGILTAVSFNPASVVSLVQLWWLFGRSRQF